MSNQSPTKRVALGELPPNATTPKRDRSPKDLLKNVDSVIDKFRPGSPLKQALLLETSSPHAEEKENRGKKRKAGDENGEEEEVRVVSPTLLKRPAGQEDVRPELPVCRTRRRVGAKRLFC